MESRSESSFIIIIITVVIIIIIDHSLKLGSRSDDQEQGSNKLARIGNCGNKNHRPLTVISSSL